MSRQLGCRLVVIPEDKLSSTFAMKTLKNFGYEKRDVRIIPVPAGKGAGEQHIRKRYVEEVNTYRKNRNHQNIGILAVIDADNKSVDERSRQLDGELKSKNQAGRTGNERIALWIPERHIETWLVHLCGGDVDEETETKTLRPSVDVKQAAEVFKRLFDKQKRETVDTLPSIQTALQETTRILE